MPETRHRAMVRKEMALLFKAIGDNDANPIPFRERRNSSKLFPRGEWSVVDRSFADHPKSESGKTRNVLVAVTAKVFVREGIDRIDDEIDRICEVMEMTIENWKPTTTYVIDGRQAFIKRVEFVGDQQRVKDMSDGPTEGPIYFGLWVHCQVGKQ